MLARRQLKQRAARLLEDATWHDVYHLWPLRTARGSAGWLFHTYGEPWRLYGSPDSDDGATLGPLVATFGAPQVLGRAASQQLRPEPGAVVEVLDSAAAGVLRRARSVRLW